MKKEIFLLFIVITMVTIPQAGATCMTANDILLLIDIENKLQINDSSIISMIDRLVCNQTTDTYSRETIDAKLETVKAMVDEIDMDIVNDTVHSEMQIYLDWFEDTAGMTQMLNAIYNNTEQGPLQNITINDSLYMKKSDMDIESIEKQLEELEVAIENVRLGSPMQGQVTYGQGLDTNTILIALVVIGVLVFIGFQAGIIKPRHLGLEKRNQMPVTGQPLQSEITYMNNPLGNPKHEVEQSRAERARKMLKEKKFQMLEKEMEKATRIDSEKDRDKRISEIETRLKSLEMED